MGNVSAPQALASSEPILLSFPFSGAVNVYIAFYDDADGLVLNAVQTDGSATLTTTRQPEGYEGAAVTATRVPLPVCTFGGIVAGAAVNVSTVTGVPGAQLQPFGLGAGASKVVLTATVVAHSGAATHYRLAVDSAVHP